MKGPLEDATVMSTDTLLHLKLLDLQNDVLKLDNSFAKHNTSVAGKPLHRSIIVTESEVSESDAEDESDGTSVLSDLISEAPYTGRIRRAFDSSMSQWIEDPIVSKWRQPTHHIYNVLTDIESLYHEWRASKIGPFSPVTDKMWLELGSLMADVGLPWHNNQINMPDEIDASWPFHFKSFETQVIRAKGSRVGDPNPGGYVCNWGEANAYCIRALQQDLREKLPDQRPLLVYDQIDRGITESAEQLFGLESYRVNLTQDLLALLGALQEMTSHGLRPIIFAATLASFDGRCDNLDVICRISNSLPVVMHVDASRNFDFITTLMDDQRQQLGIEKLKLGTKSLDGCLRLSDGSILASTIAAGGSNHTFPPPVVALKPSALGGTHVKVSYTRASDSTLAGSRDAIAPLWVALQEARFGVSGFRRVYQYCSEMRKEIIRALRSKGVDASAPEYSVDILIKGSSNSELHSLIKLGGFTTREGRALLTVQPSAQLEDLEALVDVFSMSNRPHVDESWCPTPQSFSRCYPIPEDVIDQLRNMVHSWKLATRSAAGYPFHMGSYSALGPIIGQFLNIHIPKPWIEARAREILDRRLRSFGLLKSGVRAGFKGAFTNGSTMGNRIGIHNALALFPGAHLYYSSETHYSVAKTARDCDVLTNRWSRRSCRYSEIPSEDDGSLCVERLTRQAIVDRDECQSYGEPFRIVLFLNMGTTFVGARDNLREIRKRLRELDIGIAYVHMDGALDFGFHNCGVVLGPPGIAEIEGVPVVQGVTLSHHKAMGNMVSGEVLCYSPDTELTTLGSEVDPRAVFETWLYMQVYTDADLVEMHRYCLDNASRLEAGLREINVITKRNDESAIVVLERPPAWITEEFSLRPQEDWVHFITMPHISPKMVDTFVQRVALVDEKCEVAFRQVESHLNSVMMSPLQLKRVQCCSELADKVRVHAQSLTRPACEYHEGVDLVVRASLRGALSVAAVDESDNLQVIFCVESTRDQKIRAGPVIAEAISRESNIALSDIARQLIKLMSENLHAPIISDQMSYACLPLKQRSGGLPDHVEL